MPSPLIGFAWVSQPSNQIHRRQIFKALLCHKTTNVLRSLQPLHSKMSEALLPLAFQWQKDA
jgi:hypothetical protein